MDHVTIADEEVLVPIQIEVEKPRTEAHIAQPNRRDSRADARMEEDQEDAYRRRSVAGVCEIIYSRTILLYFC